MIEWMMFFWGGFLAASLLALIIIPAIHHRAIRLTRHQLEDSIPRSAIEIRANMDCLRADFAISTYRLQRRVDELMVTSATQLSEIGRKTATINRLTVELARKTSRAEELAHKAEDHARTATNAKRRSNALQDVSTGRALRSNDIEHIPSVTEQRLVINDQRVEMGALKSGVEQSKSPIHQFQQGAPDIALRPFPGSTAPPITTKLEDLSVSLIERGQLLNECDVEIDALFQKIAAVKREPAAATKIRRRGAA